MSNNPYPTQSELDREDAASMAEDALALYEEAKDGMVMLLRTLLRGNSGRNLNNVALIILNEIEQCCILGDRPPCYIPPGTEAASNVLDAIEDGSPDAAKQHIDDHFSRYLEKLRAIAAGEEV